MVELIPYQSELLGPASVRLIVPAHQKKDIKDLPASFISEFKPSSLRLVSAISLLFALISEIIKFRPTHIHLHSTFAGIFTRPLIRLLFPKIFVIYCPHGWASDRFTPGLKSRLAEWVEFLLSVFSHRIICISTHEYKTGLRYGISENRLALIPNGVSDAPDSSSNSNEVFWPQNVCRLLFVGRLDRQKGVDLLLDAMRQLDNSFFLLVVGDYVTDANQKFPQGENFRLIGWQSRSQLFDLYDSSHAVIVPSRWEGFGLVAIEALRAGRPVLASKTGGLVDIVSDGVDGFLFQPESVSALISTIEKFRNSNYISLSSNARKKYLEKFTSVKMNEKIINVYNIH